MNTLLLAILLAAVPEGTAATVNGDAIPLADIDAALTKYKQGNVFTAEQTRSLRRIELEAQIDELLVRQYLATHGPKSDPAEVAKQIAVLAESQKQKGRTLAEFCKQAGLTEARLKEQFDIEIRLRKLIDGNTKDDVYRKYFDANRAVFDGATVTASQIFLPVSPNAADGEWAAATQKLIQLRKDIIAGQITFAAAAKKQSLDPTAADGGVIGKLIRKDPRAEEPVLKAAFELEVNAISEPVRTIDGVSLVTITTKHSGTPVTFENVLEIVKDEYAAEAKVNLVTQLRAKAEIKVLLP
ncbi:hypothetical protein BH11PLA2_BH11PLA2_03740 [soil metagenome]